ncbi:MAG: shikimate dehydrogenase [Chloroflexi bacterium RBG_16_50_9]|nr:MAG: shikimate dehydrogenase [Chloroflexi bacterium RBG_16_50_9]
MFDNAITGKTKICGVIGDPIAHTVSPAMHNAAFQSIGLDYVYVPFRVASEELGKAVAGIRAMNIRGLNVTIPHKVAIIPMLDGLDPLAEKIGAVNTIVNNEGNLRGYNTDATGFLQALLEKGVEPEGRNIVILGAGGASRAVTHVLVVRGARLTVLNRRLELGWAEALAGEILDDLNIEVKVLELGDDNLARALDGAEILVNTTSVGMLPNIEETLVPVQLLSPDIVVFDIVYNPIRTRLLREAAAAGARIIGGVDMLAWQGAQAFEKWTGQPAPLELMRDEAIKALVKYED